MRVTGRAGECQPFGRRYGRAAPAVLCCRVSRDSLQPGARDVAVVIASLDGTGARPAHWREVRRCLRSTLPPDYTLCIERFVCATRATTSRLPPTDAHHRPVLLMPTAMMATGARSITARRTDALTIASATRVHSAKRHQPTACCLPILPLE